MLTWVLLVSFAFTVHLRQKSIDSVSLIVMRHLLSQLDILSDIGVDHVVLVQSVLLIFVLNASHPRCGQQETLRMSIHLVKIIHLLTPLLFLLLLERLLLS